MLVFGRLELGRLDFLFLKAPQIDHAQAVLLVAFQFGHALPDRSPSLVLCCQFVQTVAGISIQEREPSGSIESKNGFILGMDGSQRRRQLPQKGHRRRLIIHEYSPFAAGSDFALDDDVAVFRFHAVFFEDGLQRSFVRFKHSADDCFLSAVAHHVCRSFVAQQQSQGIDQNGLSRPGLSGKQVQPGRKINRQAVDDRVVLNS